MHSAPLSVADCCEMVRILQHPDVQECFTNIHVQTAMASHEQHHIHTVLRENASIQRLLTNKKLVQRISSMYIKMQQHRHKHTQPVMK